MRGTSVKVRRSLRTRVMAASALTFLGLSAVICLVLPQAYEAQARTGLRDRTENTARGLVVLLDPATSAKRLPPAALAGWLAADPAFEAAAVFDTQGKIVAAWPEGSRGFAFGAQSAPGIVYTPVACTAFQALGENGAAGMVAVRFSTRALVRDLENVRWLFASIFLFTSVVFFILTKYLTRTILHPLEEIGRAAMCLADGEPVVQVPRTGDREIDELGEFIAKLGESRRQSRVMASPMDLLVAQGWGRNPAKPGRPEPANPIDGTVTRPPGENDPV